MTRTSDPQVALGIALFAVAVAVGFVLGLVAASVA